VKARRLSLFKIIMNVPDIFTCSGEKRHLWLRDPIMEWPNGGTFRSSVVDRLYEPKIRSESSFDLPDRAISALSSHYIARNSSHDFPSTVPNDGSAVFSAGGSLHYDITLSAPLKFFYVRSSEAHPLADKDRIVEPQHLFSVQTNNSTRIVCQGEELEKVVGEDRRVTDRSTEG
jgi:hypothetical protein